MEKSTAPPTDVPRPALRAMRPASSAALPVTQTGPASAIALPVAAARLPVCETPEPVCAVILGPSRCEHGVSIMQLPVAFPADVPVPSTISAPSPLARHVIPASMCIPAAVICPEPPARLTDPPFFVRLRPADRLIAPDLSRVELPVPTTREPLSPLGPEFFVSRNT